MRIIAAEPEFSRKFSRTSAQTCGRNVLELLRPSLPSTLNRHFHRLSEERHTCFVERVVNIGGWGPAFSGELTAIAGQLGPRLHHSRQGIEYHAGLMLRRFKVPNGTALVSRAHSLGMPAADKWPPRVLPEHVK